MNMVDWRGKEVRVIVNMIKSYHPLNLASSIPAIHRPAPFTVHHNVHCTLPRGGRYWVFIPHEQEIFRRWGNLHCTVQCTPIHYKGYYILHTS